MLFSDGTDYYWQVQMHVRCIYFIEQNNGIESHISLHVISDIHPKKCSDNILEEVTRVLARVSHDVVYVASDMV